MIRWPEYQPRSLCHFITPIIAAVGDVAADIGLGTAAAAGIGDAAAITLPDVAVTAAAPAAAASFGIGDAAASGLLASGAAADLASGLAAPAAGATGVPTAPTTAQGTPPPPAPSTLTAPGAPSPLPGGPSAITGPAVGAPAAPASVGSAATAPPTGAGTISDVISGSPGGPGTQLAALNAPAASDTGSFVPGAASGSQASGVATGSTPFTGDAAPGDASGAASGSGSSGSSSLFGNAGTAVNKFVADNPLVLPAAALGTSLLLDKQSLPGTKQISGEAGNLNAQGQQLESYLQTGTLPPGVQQGINQATDSAIASIKSRYAAMGASGSSAEQQDIANAQQVAELQGASIALQLLNTGISETGMAAQLYQYIASQSLSQDQALGSALANFAGSVARPTVTLNTTAAAG